MSEKFENDEEYVNYLKQNRVELEKIRLSLTGILNQYESSGAQVVVWEIKALERALSYSCPTQRELLASVARTIKGLKETMQDVQSIFDDVNKFLVGETK